METRQYISFGQTKQSARVFLPVVGLECYIRKRSSFAKESYYIPKKSHNDTGDDNDVDYYNNNGTLEPKFSNDFVHTVHVEIKVNLVLLCSCRGSSSSSSSNSSSSSGSSKSSCSSNANFFFHFLPEKGIQEDVNKSFPVAMDNAGLNEYFVKILSF